MTRAQVLALGCVLLGGCTAPKTSKPTSEATPAPAKAEPEPSQEPAVPDLAELEALALDCDGAELAARYRSLEPSALAAMSEAEGNASARLLAHWELLRDVKIDPGPASAFASVLEAELGQPPPSWWVETLASARRLTDTPLSAYDLGLSESGDRRGEWTDGPKGTRVRPGFVPLLSASGDRLSLDLSSGRGDLGPLPAAGHMIELDRPRAGSTIFWASFEQGQGGFRFPLHAVEAGAGGGWVSEVCGPDRKLLGGHGHLIVEIVVLEPQPAGGSGRMLESGEVRGVAVFTAESHGVAVEVFDVETGARTLAWSSDFWFAR